MPDRPGLEFFMIHEDSPYGFSVRDADDELLDGTKIDDYTGGRIMNFADYGHSAAYGSKAYPVLAADILGDWREEVILFDKSDSASINIFSTTIPTKLRVPALLHDHTYRMGVAWQNVAYNQPAHLGYYLPDSVAPRFTAIEGSMKEQTVELGSSMAPVECSIDGCP